MGQSTAVMTGDYTVFYGNGVNHHLGTGPSVSKWITSVVKWEDFVSVRMSYIITTGH